MKGKRSKSVDALKAELLSDEAGLSEYIEQRVISELGGLIGHALQDRRLTQTGLAKNIGMHQPDLNALIRGRAAHVPTLLTLRRLAKGLGVHWVIEIMPDGDIAIRERTAQEQPQEQPQEHEPISR